MDDVFWNEIILFLDFCEFYTLLKFAPPERRHYYRKRWLLNSKVDIVKGEDSDVEAEDDNYKSYKSYKSYIVNGKKHNDVGPAFIGKNRREWWINGNRHRLNGPAIEEYTEESIFFRREYFVHGKRHRLDGPAIELSDRKEYFVHGKRHRLDGPAIEYKDKTQYEWWKNGQKHRDQYENCPPAISMGRKIQTKEWWVNGKRHYFYGPAVIYPKGKEWWINGTITKSTSKLRGDLKKQGKKGESET